MRCKEVEEVLEQQGLESLPEAARKHAADCPACNNLLADLTEIVAVARELPAEVAPPDRVWISLRAQLEAEGLIKQPSVPVERSPWWSRLRDFSSNRALIGATVGLLLAAAAAQIYRHPATPAQPVTGQEATVTPKDSLEQTSQTLRQAEIDLSHVQQAGTSASGQNISSITNDSLQQNLKAIDEFIVECEQHLRQYPQDQLAREYLSRAYQQKAELLSALLDSGRSEN
jgi:gas vesicle protein